MLSSTSCGGGSTASPTSDSRTGELLRILTTSVSGAVVGQAYQFQLAASGGGQPYTWTLASGQFPPGLSMDATSGKITGTPGLPGNYSFTAEVKDSGIGESQVASENLSLAVGVAPLEIVTPALPGGVQGAVYSLQMQATGGIPPYLWSVSSGALPPGLELDPLTGKITGMPTEMGTFSVTLQVTDSGTPQSFATIVLGAAPNSSSGPYIAR